MNTPVLLCNASGLNYKDYELACSVRFQSALLNMSSLNSICRFIMSMLIDREMRIDLYIPVNQ